MGRPVIWKADDRRLMLRSSPTFDRGYVEDAGLGFGPAVANDRDADVEGDDARIAGRHDRQLR